MPEVFVKPRLKTVSGSLLTTGNSYATVPDAVALTAYFYCKGYKGKYFVLQCTTADLLFSVDVSADGTIWFNKVTDQLILIGASDELTSTESWPYYRVQVKPNVAGVHGTLAVSGELSTL
jgi:hypothetical protein